MTTEKYNWPAFTFGVCLLIEKIEVRYFDFDVEKLFSQAGWQALLFESHYYIELSYRGWPSLLTHK